MQLGYLDPHVDIPTDVMSMLALAYKSKYEEANKNYQNYISEYGNFQSPSAADVNTFNLATIGKLKDKINKFGDPDWIKTAEGQSYINNAASNVDTALIGKLKLTALNADIRNKMAALLKELGLYKLSIDPYADISNYNTAQLGVLNDLTPPRWTTVEDLVQPTGEMLAKTPLTLGHKGFTKYVGVDQNRINNTYNNMLNEWLQSNTALNYIKDYMSQGFNQLLATDKFKQDLLNTLGKYKYSQETLDQGAVENADMAIKQQDLSLKRQELNLRQLAAEAKLGAKSSPGDAPLSTWLLAMSNSRLLNVSVAGKRLNLSSPLAFGQGVSLMFNDIRGLNTGKNVSNTAIANAVINKLGTSLPELAGDAVLSTALGTHNRDKNGMYTIPASSNKFMTGDELVRRFNGVTDRKVSSVQLNINSGRFKNLKVLLSTNPHITYYDKNGSLRFATAVDVYFTTPIKSFKYEGTKDANYKIPIMTTKLFKTRLYIDNPIGQDPLNTLNANNTYRKTYETSKLVGNEYTNESLGE